MEGIDQSIHDFGRIQGWLRESYIFRQFQIDSIGPLQLEVEFSKEELTNVRTGIAEWSLGPGITKAHPRTPAHCVVL